MNDELCGYCQSLVHKGQMSKHIQDKHNLNQQQQAKLKRIIKKAENKD